MTWLGCCLISPSLLGAEEKPPAFPSHLTLANCIAIAQQNQPTIQAVQAGVGIATEQQKIARSYLLPQMDLTTRLTQLNRGRSVDSPNPVATGPLAEVFSDGAAFFSLARQLGLPAANAALANPNVPPFSTAKQVALGSLSPTFRTELIGERFVTNDVVVTQPLYTGGKIRFRNQQAQLGIRASAADLARARQQTSFEVTRAYLSILLAQALVQVAQDTAGHFRAVERLTKAALEDKENKEVTPADLYRIRSLQLLAESQVVRGRQGVELAYAALHAAMGVEPEVPLQIADDRMDFQPLALALPTLLQRAYSQRPELAKADLGVRNAALEQKLAAAQFCPDVALFGSFSSVNDDRSYLNPNHPVEWAAGIAVRYPLLTGGRRFAERRKADHQYLQAVEVVRSVRQLIGLEVEQAFLENREMAERLALAEKAEAAAKATVKSYEDQYAEDRIPSKDLPRYFENLETAQLLLSAARLSYHEHLFAYNLTLAKILLVTASDEIQTLVAVEKPDPGPGLGARDHGGTGWGSEEVSQAAQGPHFCQPSARVQPFAGENGDPAHNRNPVRANRISNGS
jgi:outer membrane protein TolC